MEILFVNNVFNLFAKADSGASQRSMRMLKALSQVGHVDVVSFVDDTVSNVPNVDVLYSKSVDLVSAPIGRIEKFLKLFQSHSPYSIYPQQPGKVKVIEDVVMMRDYDVIVCRYIPFACECGLLKYADRLVIDIDDDPKQAVRMSIHKIKSASNRLYHMIYAHTIDWTCRNVVKNVRCAFYSTPDMKYKNAQFLPNISIFQQALPRPDYGNTHPVIMMVGFFSYYPNVEGLSHFVTKIFPKVREVIPDVEFNVVGNMKDDNLRQLCLATKGVNVLGFVEDLKEQYQKCHCVVVPIYDGTGTSVKLVEAMSLGRAVVTTSCGARGVYPAFVSNEDFYLAESDDDFAQKVIRLLKYPGENKAMTEKALKKSEKYYSENMFNQIVNSAIRTKNQ